MRRADQEAASLEILEAVAGAVDAHGRQEMTAETAVETATLTIETGIATSAAVSASATEIEIGTGETHETFELAVRRRAGGAHHLEIFVTEIGMGRRWMETGHAGIRATPGRSRQGLHLPSSFRRSHEVEG